jgi:ABC-type uncharacterized transport system involved in gliding motility auxiliary subunit
MDSRIEGFPNLAGVLETYGVEVGSELIIEGNSRNFISNTPHYLIPDYAAHDITDTLSSKGIRTLFPLSSGINTLDMTRASVTVEPLLTTSGDAYGKSNPEATTINKEPGDLDGPFNLAVAVTDSYYTNEQHYTRLVVMGTSIVLDDNINAVVSGSNYDFIQGSLDWMSDNEGSVYIMPKTSRGSNLMMTQNTAILIVIFSCIVLPVLILGTGLFIWLRRRHS